MLENDEPIVLDDANNVFVGPNEYFKVVLDDFDGERVNAWHVEDAEGNQTPNLAERADGQHIDLVLGKGNRTIDHFLSRWSDTLMEELQQKVDEMEN